MEHTKQLRGEAGVGVLQEDKSVLVRLSDIPEPELAGYELPPAHKKRRRASVGWGSCFRLEALPPTPGTACLSRAVSL